MGLSIEPLHPTTPAPDPEAGARWTHFVSSYDGRKDARGWLTLQDGGETVGWMRLDQHHARLFSLIELDVARPERALELRHGALAMLPTGEASTASTSRRST